MLISDLRGFIFIHVYKNAGTSITAALDPFATTPLKRLACRVSRKLGLSLPFDPQRFPIHIKASELVDEIGRQSFDSYFSFAVVRNPWDWQVSLYRFMLKEPKQHQHELIKSFRDFDEYIRWRCEHEVRLQRDFVISPEGEVLVDDVVRYEDLDAEFARICSRIGVSTSLPRLNVSNTQPYQDFYDEETRELVRAAFHADIEMFGYEA